MSNEMNRRKFLKLTGTVGLATSVAEHWAAARAEAAGEKARILLPLTVHLPVRPLLPAALRVLPARLVRL